MKIFTKIDKVKGFCTNITLRDMNETYLNMLIATNNNIDQNDHDYSTTSNPDYKRQETKDKIYNQIENTNWETESNYHNSYRVNGKYNKGRTLIAKKK